MQTPTDIYKMRCQDSINKMPGIGVSIHFMNNDADEDKYG